MVVRGRPAVRGNGMAPAVADRGPGDTRLRLYRNPLRLAVSRAPWTAAGYLVSYLALSWVLFGVAFSAVTAAAAVAITLAGIPLLAAAAGVVRGCANVERGLLRRVIAEPVRGGYRQVTEPGMRAQVRTRWRDPGTWRDLAYLVGLWVPLYVVDTVVLGVWAWFIGWITLPAWYWVPWMQYHGRRIHGYQLGFYFPHGPDGPGTVGVFVDSLPKALLVAVVGLLFFLAFNYVLVLTARAHARIARSLLRPPTDPLAPAKEVLTRPGPLGSLQMEMPNGS